VLRLSRKVLTVSAGIGVMICLWSLTSSRGQEQPRENAGFSKWRAHDFSENAFVGSRACVQCHAPEAKAHSHSAMAQALSAVADCQLLSTRPRLTFRNGSYNYQITRQGNRSIYTVTNGESSISKPLLYCFGFGRVGQTYLFEHNGLFYETRLSYYQQIKGLGFTTGHPQREPTSLEEALGRPLGTDEAGTCFGCHSTAGLNGSQLQLERIIPGVACEGCHGPGQAHLVAMKAQRSKDLQIFNPGYLDADTLSQEFCGSCHRGFDEVMLLPIQGGINNIRFQPYRIFNSPGHKGDRRIGCLACHDPHDRVEHQAAFYDSKCLACHLSVLGEAKTSYRNAPACPVSRKQCVTCHMPKVEVPEMHSAFTDHWIRIAKPNEPPPN
jgi:cytochrome c554/c'-like protein